MYPAFKRVIVLFVVFCYSINLFQFSDVHAANAKPEDELNQNFYNKTKYNLNPHVEILKDPSKELTISDVTSPDYNDMFTPHNDKNAPNYSYLDAAVWMKIDLSHLNQDSQWLMELGYPLLGEIDFYYLDESGDYSSVKTGNTLPFNTREIDYRNFVFDLNSKFHGDEPFYLRIHTDTAMILPLTLWEMDTFISKTDKSQFLLGLYYGVIVIIILYGLFLYFLPA